MTHLMQWMTFLSLVAAIMGSTCIRQLSAKSSPSSSPYVNLITRALLSPVPPEVYYDTAQLTKKWGYPVEKHTAVTEDGYQIGIFRIPGSKRSPSSPRKPVVFLQHGLMQSSDQWVTRGPQKDLVFLLADRGYDVWMGNMRGNQYARRHSKLSAQDLAFWKFSWHENGFYDVAASIRLALSVAGVPDLLYVGHSMGTSSAIVLLSSRPEFNQLVRAAFFLAPIGVFKDAKGLLAPGLGLGRILEAQFRHYDVHGPILLRSATLSKFLYNFCSPPQNDLCLGVYFAIAGYSPTQVNETEFPIQMSHLPTGSSLGQFRHYVQSYVKGELRYFDHGTRENNRLYGSSLPPIYPLDRITTPVLLFYSKGDALASEADTMFLSKMLPNIQALEKVPLDTFNHGDYMWAVDSYRLLYDKLLNYMKRF